MLLRSIVIVIAILLCGYRICFFRKRHNSILAALGLALNHRSILHLILGVVVGATAISCIFFFEWSVGFLQVLKVDWVSVSGDDFLTFVAKPFLEEFVFRCAILGALVLLIPRRLIAVIISALLFGGVHVINANAGFISVFSTILGGVAYGLAYLFHERIWFPLGLHSAWNYFQSCVFGLPLSGGFKGSNSLIKQHDIGPAALTGGAYGPEGGMIGLCARILVIGFIAALLLYERHRFRRDTSTRSAEPS